MDCVLITPTSLVVSGLSLFSGFGLGTLLTPAFALFFRVPTANSLQSPTPRRA